MRSSDWSSDLCSSDLCHAVAEHVFRKPVRGLFVTERGPQEIAFGAGVFRPDARMRRFVAFGEAQNFVVLLLGEVACQVVFVESLHDDDDRKSVVEGKRVYGRAALGGRSYMKRN